MLTDQGQTLSEQCHELCRADTELLAAADAFSKAEAKVKAVAERAVEAAHDAEPATADPELRADLRGWGSYRGLMLRALLGGASCRAELEPRCELFLDEWTPNRWPQLRRLIDKEAGANCPLWCPDNKAAELRLTLTTEGEALRARAAELLKAEEAALNFAAKQREEDAATEAKAAKSPAAKAQAARLVEEGLGEGATWHNPPLQPHQLICLTKEGSVTEVSTADSVEDNYRIGPGDSQQIESK